MADLTPIKHSKANAGSFDAIDPLDSRYFDEVVAGYLSERSRLAYQLHVEAALAHTLADFGICSPQVAKQIDLASRKVSAEEIYEEEATTRHDIKAIVNCIKKYVDDEAKPFVHFGATSYDIVATANALQMRAVIQQVVIPRLATLIDILAELSQRYAKTVQIGRTHGQHAVPITFGYALSEYVSRLGTSAIALQALSQELYGKFSGAVGASNALSIFVDDPVKFEKTLLQKLGLSAAPYATQIVPPEGMIRLIDELAIASGIMANLSHDMRHLQRSEINEIREAFAPGQTGSSTMAHKRNPWNFENVISMHKQVSAQLLNANLNISSEHQRDLTDSANGRFFVLVPALVSAMTQRLTKVMAKLEVDEAAMNKNLHLSAGAIAAEPLYLLFEKYGHTAAHEKAKTLAPASLAAQKPLVEVIQDDQEAATYWQQFSAQEQLIIKDPASHYSGLSTQKTKAVITTWNKQRTSIIGK